MKIGDRVFVRGYVDEIRKDTVIVRNDGGYFGTIPSEVITGELPSAQPDSKELSSTHKALDTISRQAALDALDTWDKFGCGPDGRLVRYDDDNHYVPYVHYDDMVHAIKHLPSAQPEKRTEERTETHACDCVSGVAAIVAAIEAVDEWDGGYNVQRANMIRDAIKALPSAQPKRMKGRWIYGEHDVAMCDGYRCDKCGFFVPWDYKYTFIDFINDYHFCPNCGSDMRGEEDEA